MDGKELDKNIKVGRSSHTNCLESVVFPVMPTNYHVPPSVSRLCQSSQDSVGCPKNVQKSPIGRAMKANGKKAVDELGREGDLMTSMTICNFVCFLTCSASAPSIERSATLTVKFDCFGAALSADPPNLFCLTSTIF